MARSMCQELMEALLEYVDGDLPAERRQEFAKHLCGCAPCFIYVETYQATIDISRALPKADPLPADVERRLRAAVEAEQGRG